MAILLGIRFLPKLDRQTVPKLDLPGIIMAPIAFVMLAYGVHEGSKDWGSLATISILIVGGLALIGFIVGARPLVLLGITSITAALFMLSNNSLQTELWKINHYWIMWCSTGTFSQQTTKN